jgi:hypothetical protein
MPRSWPTGTGGFTERVGESPVLIKTPERFTMGKKAQAYFCKVVEEEVQISLKNKISLGPKYRKDYFVQCDQEECQYVDENASPCPLSVEMFGKTLLV